MVKGLCWCHSAKDLVVDRVFWKYLKALNRMASVLIREIQWEIEHVREMKGTMLKPVS